MALEVVHTASQMSKAGRDAYRKEELYRRQVDHVEKSMKQSQTWNVFVPSLLPVPPRESKYGKRFGIDSLSAWFVLNNLLILDKSGCTYDCFPAILSDAVILLYVVLMRSPKIHH